MKMSEYLQSLFEISHGTKAEKGLGFTEEYMLTPDILKAPIVQEALLRCDEFENVKHLVILDEPFIQLEKGGEVETHKTVTVKVGDTLKFKGPKVYLYSIFLTPIIYDKENLTEPVKNEACITPIFYGSDFVPRRGITLFLTPEFNSSNPEELQSEVKELLIERFKNVLNNPGEYLMKEKRAIMICGYFPEGTFEEAKTEKCVKVFMENGELKQTMELMNSEKSQYVLL